MTKTNSQHDPHLAEAQRLGHEERDASPKAVIIAGSGLLVLLMAAMLAMQLLTAWWDIPATAGPTESYSAGRAGSEVRMQQQRLDQQEEQRQRLDSYAWIDRRAKLAQIPIERAMQLIADDPTLLEPFPSASAESQTEGKGAKNNE